MIGGYTKEELEKDRLLSTELLAAKVHELTSLNIRGWSRPKLLRKLQEVFDRDQGHRTIYEMAGKMVGL
jgi:hypothetical protein